MAIENSLDAVLNSKTKVKIIRLFISRTSAFRVSGRDIARLINVSPPATHAALKELQSLNILRLEIIGKQHIYSLNDKNRIVKDILKPGFEKELSIKEDIKNFLNSRIKETGIRKYLISVILYGSLQRNQTDNRSDVDIAVIVRDKNDKKEIENKFIENIGVEFREYFGVHLDAYVKSKEEFINRMRKHLSPVESLMKSYSVIFGEDPLDFIQSL